MYNHSRKSDNNRCNSSINSSSSNINSNVSSDRSRLSRMSNEISVIV